ncbi:MAG: SDR family oxidoreductase [Paracoccaceae bacterium]|nr:SDR family oxidoreductase [Paracoccaceae bacterium]
MDLGLEGKIFIVTGGGSGIGASVVEKLSSNGATPVIFDKSKPDSIFYNHIKKKSPRSVWKTLDLCNDQDCNEAVKDVLAELSKIDGLVNNAGINDSVGLTAGTKEFRRSLEKNLVHYYTMANLCVPELKKSNGSIVNVSSKVVLTGQSGTSAYAAAKGGILALTREWATEFANCGLRVNAVIPGETMTPMYKKWLEGFENPDKKLKRIISRIPLENRMTQAEEVAMPIVFLLSRWAGHMTGQWLVVDGGYSHLDRALT